MENNSEKILVKSYVELSVLCLNTNIKFIERRDAFHLYVTQWGWVYEEKLSDDEKALIDSLVNEFGRGHLFPTAHGRAEITPEFLEVAISENDIQEDYLDEFEATVNDVSYPGRRNGILYYWREDYLAFLEKK